jgi:hypothetical protein
MIKEKKRMKDGSNNSDKVACLCQLAEDEGKNLFEKKRNKRIVQSGYGGPFVFYSNTHYPQQVVARADYPVSTQDQQLPIKDRLSRRQMQVLFQYNTFVPVVA